LFSISFKYIPIQIRNKISLSLSLSFSNVQKIKQRSETKKKLLCSSFSWSFFGAFVQRSVQLGSSIEDGGWMDGLEKLIKCAYHHTPTIVIHTAA